MPLFEVGEEKEWSRFAQRTSSIKRPKEITCFSFDEQHKLRHDDSGISYYYTPKLGVNLAAGFDTFRQLDDTGDDHIEALLAALQAKEQKDGTRVQADFVTWRGMMTKASSIMGGWVQGCLRDECYVFPRNHVSGYPLGLEHIKLETLSALADATDPVHSYIEENKVRKLEDRAQQAKTAHHGNPASQDMMSYWGYKFETLCLLPTPWAETSRDFIENREHAVVDNHAQYCSVVQTGIDDMKIILAGEVDAIWDQKPTDPLDRINWVELKTMQKPDLPRDTMKLERKLQKFWAQSFLLGVPKIIVGYRDNHREARLLEVQEFETTKIPSMVQQQGRASWNKETCIGFMSAFLEFLKTHITEGGTWAIRRTSRYAPILLDKQDETGYGGILTDDFVQWRKDLAAREDAAQGAAV